jgi:hypothetical protein
VRWLDSLLVALGLQKKVPNDILTETGADMLTESGATLDLER